MTESASSLKAYYPIGTPGKPWTSVEDDQWRTERIQLRRSYQDDVVAKLDALSESTDALTVTKFGAVSHDAAGSVREYPLFAITSTGWDTNNGKPNVLVTGGVHGYETSGVHGALQFLAEHAVELCGKCNICVIPCVSPWSYEHIQRWQGDLQDPNRSFHRVETDEAKQTKESQAVIEFLKKLEKEYKRDDTSSSSFWTMHVDLHETTDTDETEFMPARASKGGAETFTPDIIPDGFYLVADDERVEPTFQTSVLERVQKVTHLAEPAKGDTIIGEPVVGKEGPLRSLIAVPAKKLGLCCGVTDASFACTTEVYPDSPRGITPQECNDAQVACVLGGIDHILSVTSKS